VRKPFNPLSRLRGYEVQLLLYFGFMPQWRMWPAICILSLALSALPRTEFRLQPVDESAQRPDFLAFRTELRQAVEHHDVSGVMRAVHPKIKNGFDGDDGVEAFKKKWNLNQPDSELWKELAAVLALGGTFTERDTFTAPYTFSRWPDDVDSFDHVAVIASNVRIRSGPDVESAAIASASFSILELDSDSQPETSDWTRVLIDGKRGYIKSEFVRSPIDYRAMFQFSNGRWWMTFFAAGD
jgi:hypothetical protein